jgi:hypothetical protein
VGISRRRVAAFVLSVCALTVAAYAASWTGGWRQRSDGVRVQTYSLDVSRFGLAPAVYWLPSPDRLLLVPAALVPLAGEAQDGGAQSSGAAEDGEILVVDLATGGGTWQPSSRVAGAEARHVFWSLPQHLDVRPDEEILHAEPGGRGLTAALTFGGFGVSIPSYNANIPPFGEPGWRLQRRRFGSWRLRAGEPGSSRPELELTLRVLNSSHEVEMASLAAWLPGGRYLVITPKTGAPSLLLAGPFRTASPSESTPMDRG